jgi:hypothetical protein
MRVYALNLVEMVILDLASQTERTLGAQGLNPYHSDSALESLFQMFSIRIMSWDFKAADKPLPRSERRFGYTVESAAAKVPGDALHSGRRVVMEQQYGPMQVVTRSFPALRGKRILQASRLIQASVNCRQFQRIG